VTAPAASGGRAGRDVEPGDDRALRPAGQQADGGQGRDQRRVHPAGSGAARGAWTRGQRAGQLDAADGYREDRDDLGGEQPPAGLHVLAEHRDPVAGAESSASPRVSGGWTAISEPACSAFCSMNSAPTPAIAVPYSSQLLKNATTPCQRGHRALQQRRGQRVSRRRRTAPNSAARALPRARMPAPITTTWKAPVAIRTSNPDTDAGAVVPPPDGAAAASPRPRDTVTTATAIQVVRGSLRRGQPARHQEGERQFDDEDGLDQGDRPGGQRDGLAHRGQHDHADAGQPHLVLEQVGEQRQAQVLAAGAVEAAIRCRTDAKPFNSAVSSANKTDTTAALSSVAG